MTKSIAKKNIISLLQETGGGVSFVELSRIEGFTDLTESAYEILFPGNDTIVLWSGISKVYVDALKELRDEGVYHYWPTSLLVYHVDGKMLNMPIAKSNRKYKQDRWLPVVLNLGKPTKANCR